MSEDNNKKLIDYARAAWPNLRKYFIIVLVGAIGISAAIPDDKYRIGVTSALAVTLMFFIFDIYSAITERLDAIKARLPDVDSKTFPKFSYIIPSLNKILDDKAKLRQQAHVQVIAVSAHCTWPYFKDRITEAIEKIDGRCRLKVDIMICSDTTLQRWGVMDWLDLKRSMVAQYEMFINDHRQAFIDKDISVTFYEHDNLPHWHGVMINGEILFLGRTEWKKSKETGRWLLKVGQVEYRRFDKRDGFGGDPRIERFESWAARYRERHAEIIQKAQEAEQGGDGQPPSRPQSP